MVGYDGGDSAVLCFQTICKNVAVVLLNGILHQGIVAHKQLIIFAIQSEIPAGTEPTRRFQSRQNLARCVSEFDSIVPKAFWPYLKNALPDAAIGLAAALLHHGKHGFVLSQMKL